jgi:putative FmdB family regulatory protein
MPIYEYLCRSCGKKFEVLQRFSDEPLLIHPECGGSVDKLISTSALQFKGSGWYVNDYAKGGASTPSDTIPGSRQAEAKTDGGKSDGNNSDGGKSDGSKSESGESKSESKTEAKPAASESKPSTTSSPSADSK